MRIVTFSGDHYELGYRLGQESRVVFADYIRTSQQYQKLLEWRDSDWLEDVAKRIERALPELYTELRGIADGCQQDFMDILLWNCRGDLQAVGPEGCTSIGVRHEGHALVAHNEDGDPELRPHCFLLDATLDNGTRFVTFAYPASIPGHTLAANNHGVAYTVNNIRLTELQAGIPRMLVSRSLLDARDTHQFISLLEQHTRSGGFHYTVADSKTLIPQSIEAPFHKVSAIAAADICVHANHLVHEQLEDVAQLITHSSLCRQQRMEELAYSYAEQGIAPDESQCLHILRDTEAELPIYRMSPDDPDDENTLATAVFTLDEQGIRMSVYDPISFNKVLDTLI